MELIVFTLIILTIGSMIGLSMISFKIAYKALVEVNELKTELAHKTSKINKSTKP